MGSVKEARNRFWHTIVELANTSGMPKAEWCRKNCISMKTFSHYEGIFRRQEARKAAYNKAEVDDGTAKDSPESFKKIHAETSGSERTGKTEQIAEELEEPATDDTSMMKVIDTSSEESGLKTGIEPDQPAGSAESEKSNESAGVEKGRYFEVPISGRSGFLPIEKEAGKQKKSRKLKTAALAEAEPNKPERAESFIEEGTAKDTITIEADGIRLVIGSDVGEETLRNILKAVQKHA